MALAGITCVGEFHYLHHAPGRRAATPTRTRWATALIAAAAEAGIRITLLDTLYLTSTVDGAAARGSAAAIRRRRRRRAGRRGSARSSRPTTPASARPPTRSGPCRRRTWPEFAARVADLPDPRPPVRAAGRERGLPGPVRPHPDPGAGRRRAARPEHHRGARHPSHRRGPDRCSATAGTDVCFCPTTERDLADGIGPARALVDAGLAALPRLGQPRRDRPVRGGPRGRARRAAARRAPRPLRRRRAARRRDHGRPRGAGLARRRARSTIGARADLVTVRLDTVRTAGHDDPAAAVVFAATAADVTDVVVDGRPIVQRWTAPARRRTCPAR